MDESMDAKSLDCNVPVWSVLNKKACISLWRYRLFILLCTALYYWVVPRAGIEPARLAALDFESSASTSSAISATHEQNYDRVIRFLQAPRLICCYILWFRSSKTLVCLILQHILFLIF
jgi:hypothetical protein